MTAFASALQQINGNTLPLAIPNNWHEAFSMLRSLLSERLPKHKSVIFFDKFPWIHTPKSNFIQAFDHFWNSWAAWENRLVVVICGSAASWMIRKVLNGPWWAA